MIFFKKTALITLIACITASVQASLLQTNEQYDENKLPIVYHEEYNVTFGWFDTVISKLHPFDGKKYKKIAENLQKEGLMSDFYTPKLATNDDLLKVHSQEYLDSLYSSWTLSKAVDQEFYLAWMPNSILQRKFVDPIRYAVGGTVLAADLAMKHGWAINIGGGFHHAKNNAAEGGCIFQDVPLAIKRLREKYNNSELRVLIIDLDAHQGNGFADYVKNDEYTYIFDMYNENEEPFEKSARKGITFDHSLKGGHLGLFDTVIDRRVNDDHYLNILCSKLPEAIKTLINQEKKPDLIVFNAGSDPHIKDPWGCMALSDGGIIARDQFVFDQAQKNGIPIIMVLAGGYGSHNADLVFRSIKNIIEFKTK